VITIVAWQTYVNPFLFRGRDVHGWRKEIRNWKKNFSISTTFWLPWKILHLSTIKNSQPTDPFRTKSKDAIITKFCLLFFHGRISFLICFFRYPSQQIEKDEEKNSSLIRRLEMVCRIQSADEERILIRIGIFLNNGIILFDWATDSIGVYLITICNCGIRLVAKCVLRLIL
jgi:hypothetical protein